MISVNGNSSGVFATPGLTSSSNGEDYVILLFSERPICRQFSEKLLSQNLSKIIFSTFPVDFKIFRELCENTPTKKAGQDE